MKTIKTITIITIVLFFVACKKQAGPQGANGEPGVNGTVPNGTITGRVVQYDEYGNPSTSAWNTTTVSIDGTTMVTITDVSGNYSLTNVPAGVYTISFLKPTTTKYQQQQISFPGNGLLYVNCTIYDKATFNITGYVKDTVISSVQQVIANIATTASASGRYFTIIYGKSNTLSISNISSYNYSEDLFIYPNNTSFLFYCYTYNNASFNSIFTSGSIIYVKVYPNNTQKSSYFDFPSNRFVYTGCGTPIATTFTLTKS